MSTLFERLHARRLLANHRERKNRYVPNLISMGVVKRKLTRQEARQVTNEVMSTGIKDPNTRFALAIIKSMEITH